MIRKKVDGRTPGPILLVFRISDSVLSSMTIALTGLTLATCVFYALGLLIGGFHGRRQILFIVVAVILLRFMTPIMMKATSEEGLEELKRNRVFELALLLVTITRNSLAAIVLFRLALYAGVLFGEKGVDEGSSPLWHILRQVLLS